ncbi:adenine nucleotide alpha hydrolase [Ulvibacterium marinum]|uniref:adenine nucleotide alpha hydrolase n=1 Tax=Ulvibacterium marinum TaxID=2419782 RepID=UPI0024959B67|nr:adenine nucleotide alpha hydrolase [Ulvibacterium marinum]
MIKNPKTYFNWSTGKDAALALYHLQNGEKHHIDRLLTTINSHHDRVSMHGLRRELLTEQVKEIGLPLTVIELPEEPTMEVYDTAMERVIGKLHSEGYTHCGFGDIFLEDLRIYRETKLSPYDIECCFPLWKRDSKELITEFLDLGFRAIIIALNSEVLDVSFAGREIDENFLKDLPSNVDPCGENGEFHTFCFDGPIFTNPVEFTLGEKVYREYKRPKDQDTGTVGHSMGFWFSDLLPIEKRQNN